MEPRQLEEIEPLFTIVHGDGQLCFNTCKSFPPIALIHLKKKLSAPVDLGHLTAES